MHALTVLGGLSPTLPLLKIASNLGHFPLGGDLYPAKIQSGSWHRAGFRLYWTWLSRHRIRSGRKCVSVELRELIFRLVAENPTWGSPRIHGELKMLGFDVSERTVLRWMRKAPRIENRRSDGQHF
jgi:hypothetical protein